MKTIYLKLKDNPYELEVEEAWLEAKGVVIARVRCPESEWSANLQIEVTQINEGSYEAAPVVLQGVETNLADAVDES